MSIKTDNEITVKLKCTTDELKSQLLQNGFQVTKHFTIHDYFFIPKELDIKGLSAREVISRAVLIRDIVDLDSNRRDQKFTFKVKEINSAGEILSQTAYNCGITDISSATAFIEAVGYRKLMEIEEDDYILAAPDGFEIATKDIKNGDNLIEIEPTEEYNTIDKIIARLNESSVPFYDDEYFVKKAEIEYEKLNLSRI